MPKQLSQVDFCLCLRIQSNVLPSPSQKVTHLLTDSQHDEFGILHIWDRKAEQTSIKSTREVCFRSVRIDFSTATRPEISSFMVGNTYVCWAFLKHPEFRLREEYA